MVLALSILFLVSAPPKWVIGVGAGAVAAVHAGLCLLALSFEPARAALRWSVYLLAAAMAAATIGYFVLVLLACGAFELAWRQSAVLCAELLGWTDATQWRGESCGLALEKV